MKKLIYTASTFAPFAFVGQVFASGPETLEIPKPQSVEITDLGLFISRAINVALLVAAVMVFVYMVWGGIQWITSGGDKAKTEEARSRITSALIGLAVVAAAWAVMLLVQYFFGLTVFETGQAVPPGYGK